MEKIQDFNGGNASIKLRKRYNEEKLQKTQINKLLNVKTSKNQESKQKFFK